MSEWDEILQANVWYQGQLWDAPFLDHALPADLSGLDCTWCEEGIGPTDNAVKMTNTVSHLECLLCITLGNVAHLEKCCSCYIADPTMRRHDDDYTSFHEQARATLRWLLSHQGRFRPT